MSFAKSIKSYHNKMVGTLVSRGAIVSNAPAGSTIPLSVWLYDSNDRVVLSLQSGIVSALVSFTAHHMRTFNSSTAKTYFFPKNITLNPGQIIVFSPVMGGLKTVAVFTGGTQTDTFDMVTTLSQESGSDKAMMLAHTDSYMGKVLTLAKLHALLGSSRKEFNDHLASLNIKDEAETKKLTKPQFDLINSANATVQLQGSKTDLDDQTIFDETSMLCTAVNTRLAAIANAAHPEMWDVSVPDNQIKMINQAANGLFNWYYSHMGQFLTSINMSTSQMNNSYSTTSIKLDAMVDIFKSLSLPGDKLQELSGAVDAFVDSMSTLSSESSDKGLHNAKLVNFFSIQPPVGSPDLQHVAKMRMFYLQFNETTHSWSNSCSSGSTYELDTSLFTLDVEVNRQIAHLTYDHNKNMVVTSAEATLDDMGAAGASNTVPPVKADTPSPIGPAPVS